MKNTKQVSILLGISERMVRKHAENLKIKRVGKYYILTSKDIEKIKLRLGKVGKPSKK